jgi:hypothetical protein
LGKDFHTEFNKTMEQALASIKVPNIDAWRDEVEAQLEDLVNFLFILFILFYFLFHFSFSFPFSIHLFKLKKQN